MSKKIKLTEILQQHADHYLSMLMAESATDKSLSAEYENIELAIARVRENITTSDYTAEQLEKKLKLIRGY